ncbi:MAG: TRAP transporter small permease subunit [Rhodospirillaceae bacterium]|nr:TRAP transporter small permease subunit [Rhodospirillaceae bacterium]MBT5457810.1 TRAP transporter small permease subunit [Rhodospirillaceae bacterium]
MSVLVKLYNHLLHGMAIGAGIAISTATALIIIDVLMRISGLQPLLFVLTVVEYILLYFTMLAAPYLLRIKGHVFIDAVTQFMPPAVKKVIAKAVYLACFIACCIYGYQLVNLLVEAIQSGEIDMRSMEIPAWILFVPMPLCFFMCAVEFVRYLIGIDDMYSQDLIERENV